MKIRDREISLKQFFFLSIYYIFLRYLPASTAPLIGKQLRKLRYHCCKNIFKKCGKNVNIESGAFFASGVDIEIGDNSSIGINAHVPGDIVIGKNVMMGPNCYILNINHNFSRTDIDMIYQGKTGRIPTKIGDDVWIGRNVIFTPGRIVKKGTIIGAGCVLCKDFPEYAIVGGNPSKLIRIRQ